MAEGKPIKLTVTYYACVGEETCHAARQSYVLYRRRDRDGGGARGEGAGLWEPEAFARQILARGKSGDKVSEGTTRRSDVSRNEGTLQRRMW